MNSPCMNCPERFTACHDHCPKDARGEYGYGKWKADREAEKVAEAQRKALTWTNGKRRAKWAKINREK